MSDVAYSSTDPNPEPAPTEPVVVQQENLDEWRAHQRAHGMETDPRLPEPAPMTPQEIGDAASGRTSDDAVAREMGRELRKQREREGHDWEDKAPIIEVKARAESFKDVGAATRERTDTRQLAEKDALMRAGADENLADAVATKHRERLLKAGVDSKLVDELIDNPPTPVPMAKPDGQPIDADETFDNVWSATKALRRGREVVEAARLAQEREWAAQIAQYQEAPAAAEAVSAEQPAPTPQEPTAEQRQEAERLAAERFQLAHQAAALQMTAEERSLVARDQAWDNWLERTPEAKSWEAWNYTQQNNPQRAAALVKEFAKAQQAKNAIAHRRGELNTIRAYQGAQYQAVQNAARAQLNQQYDNQFSEMLQKEMPELSQGKALRDLQRAAHDELKSRGMSDQQIDYEWRYGALRTPEAQMLTARAAKLRLMEQRAREISSHRQRVPAPQVPGVWAPRGADHAEEIGRLQRQLETQTGNRAIMTATRLQQLRREHGLV